jgi:nitrate/TMAO reductase-like tetraheme cytochrome c subunit
MPDPTPRSLWKNWTSLAGFVLAGGALFAFLLLFVIDHLGKSESPYLGILTYLVVPAFLVGGLAVAVVGAIGYRRLLRRQPHGEIPHLSIDLARRRDRTLLLWFGAGTAGFLMLTSVGSYQAYHVAESNAFCGTVCHSVMKPEYTAYQHSPHANVKCVECHVGSGAGSFVKSKLNGSRQLLSLITGRYPRPIPAPVHGLRSASETCESCHTPRKVTGDLFREYRHFLSDDDNTPYTARLMLHVGGGAGTGSGIHWHMNPASKVEYFAKDEKRQEIPWVRVTDASGKSTVFRTEDFQGEPPAGKLRTMDCTDCHNRPGHDYQSPNDAVEHAMAAGLVDPTIPDAKGTLVELLTAPYASEADAAAKIPEGLRLAYANRPVPKPAAPAEAAQVEGPVADPPPPPPTLEAMQATVLGIYQANFFPGMKADWSAYPDDSGHKDAPGCFRCHDRKHVMVGESPRPMKANDCKTCHTIVGQGAGEDLATTNLEGVKFEHPAGPAGKGLCSDCHTGKKQEE